MAGLGSSQADARAALVLPGLELVVLDDVRVVLLVCGLVVSAAAHGVAGGPESSLRSFFPANFPISVHFSPHSFLPPGLSTDPTK